MKFTVPKATFLDAVAQAAAVLEKNPFKPAFGCVHITASRTGIYVRGVSTSADLTITVPHTPDLFGAASFAAKVLLATLKSSPSETVSMEAGRAGKVKVTVGNATHVLNVTDPSEVPGHSMLYEGDSVTITHKASDLVRAMSVMSVVVLPTGSTYGMLGVAVEAEGDGIRYMTTDSTRVVYTDVVGTYKGEMLESSLLPKPAVDEILALCEGCGEADVTLTLQHDRGRLTLDYVDYLFRLVDGKPIDYRSILPRMKRTVTIKAKRDDLLLAIKAVMPTATGSVSQVRCNWKDGASTFTTEAVDTGSSECRADTTSNGEAVDILLSGRMLHDGLVLAGPEVVLEMHDRMSAVFLSDGGPWSYILSPQRPA